jgi:hypothetical protein
VKEGLRHEKTEKNCDKGKKLMLEVEHMVGRKAELSDLNKDLKGRSAVAHRIPG